MGWRCSPRSATARWRRWGSTARPGAHARSTAGSSISIREMRRPARARPCRPKPRRPNSKKRDFDAAEFADYDAMRMRLGIARIGARSGRRQGVAPRMRVRGVERRRFRKGLLCRTGSDDAHEAPRAGEKAPAAGRDRWRGTVARHKGDARRRRGGRAALVAGQFGTRAVAPRRHGGRSHRGRKDPEQQLSRPRSSRGGKVGHCTTSYLTLPSPPRGGEGN